jgi:preprotein translocase subunit SecD
MVNIARWKTILVLLVCAWAFVYSLPNVVVAMGGTMPRFMPKQTVNLGLDLQGGSHLLMQVEVESVFHDRQENLYTAVKIELRKQKIANFRVSSIPRGVHVALDTEQDAEAVRKILRKFDPDMDVTSPDPKAVDATLSPVAVKRIQDQTMEQSIEIVRRRVDETGTREPAIQRQGDDRIIVELPGVGDPQHIIDLIGKTAQLSFNLVDMGKGVEGGTVTYPMVEDGETEEKGRTLSISRRPLITGDMLTNAQPSQDQNGMPDVNFNLNSVGAKRFCDVTSKHTGELFAIVLDKKVISAPRINEPICGGAAHITGSFTVQQTTDLALLLRAGALPAPIKPIEQRTVGPTLGSDSVQAGKKACLMALVFVTIFACTVYGLFGVFASAALLVNMVMIIAVMSMLQATLTLPGIAGIVLAIGLAVDGNVLVFERIKEEIRSGRSVLSAIDTGYKRARTTIIDSNLTALIAALILFSFGTGPIKGFAVTMCIGVVTSYFAAIMLTRLMVLTWYGMKKPKEMAV